MKEAIIVDLDGTLYNSSGRKHYVEGEKKNYDMFHKASKFDLPNEWCVSIMDATEYDILLVSGRPDTYMLEALEWIKKHNIPMDALFMRKAGDYRKDYIIKKEIYDSHIKPFYEVVFVLDDRKQVADMWRAEGLICLLCHEGDF